MPAKYIKISENLINECNYLNKIGINKLPSEEKLCQEYECSRQTIRAALKILEEKGIIEKFHGSGSYICPDNLEHTRNIMFISRNPNEFIYPDIVRDLKSKLLSQNYLLSSFATFSSYEKEREILTQAITYKPAFIILEAISNIIPSPNTDILDQIRKEKIPIIYLFTSYSSNKTDTVISLNDRNESYKLISKILTGPKEIGCIMLSDDSRGHSRYLGILDACKSFDSNLIPHSYWYTTAEHIAMLEGKPTFIDAAIQTLKLCSVIVCQNDELAYYINKRIYTSYNSNSYKPVIIGFGKSYYSSQANDFISIGPSIGSISDAVISAITSIKKGLNPNIKPIPFVDS